MALEALTIHGGADWAAQFLATARDRVSAHVADRVHRKAAGNVLVRQDELRTDVARRRNDAAEQISDALSKRGGNPRPALESLAIDAAAYGALLIEPRFNRRDMMTMGSGGR